MSRASLAAAFLAASSISALAADIPGRVVKPSPAQATASSCLEKTGLPTDIFGFTGGTDVSDLGSLSGSAEYNGGFKTRFGSATNTLAKFQLSYGLLNCLEVGPYLQGTFGRSSAQGFSTDSNAYGGGVEIKYKLLGRDVHGVGLTLVFEPNVNRGSIESKLFGFKLGSTDFTSANTSSRILLDAQLAPRLFGALNLEHTANWTGDNSYVRSSGLNIRAALAYQLTETFYLGVEGSHQRAYTGNFLNKDLGHAFFTGPAFFWQISPSVSLTGAYNVQVTGRAKTELFNLDLTNFNQHLAKLKLAVSF